MARRTVSARRRVLVVGYCEVDGAHIVGFDNQTDASTRGAPDGTPFGGSADLSPDFWTCVARLAAVRGSGGLDAARVCVAVPGKGRRASPFGKRVVDVAASVDVAEATVYRWVRQDRVDRGELAGTSTSETAELRAA